MFFRKNNPTGHDSMNGVYLAPCPNKPNCVCSLALRESEHYIEPFIFHNDPQSELKLLQAVMASIQGVGVISVKIDYLHAEYRSRFLRFVDDVEFYWDEEEQLCHVRSAARLGYSDFGVNRKRVEKIRQEFIQHHNEQD